jgi:hypothetical protein
MKRTVAGVSVDVTVADAFSGRCSIVQFTKLRDGKYCEVLLRVGSTGKGGREPVWAKFPVKLHRLPPMDAVLKWAWVLVRREGIRFRYQLQLTLEHESFGANSAPRSGKVAMNFGWRQLQDGRIRVAYAVSEDGEQFQCVLPTIVKTGREHAQGIASVRDLEFNAAIAQVVALRKSGSASEWFLAETEHAHQWRSKNRLAWLVQQWSRNRFSEDEAFFTACDLWRKRDRHLLDYEEGDRNHSINRRNKHFEACVKWLARYETIIVDDSDHSKLNENPEPEERQGSEKAQKRNKAAGGSATLRKMIEQRHGSHVIRHPAPMITRIHHRCGTEQQYQSPSKMIQHCPVCKETFDIDANACKNMLSERSRDSENPRSARTAESQEKSAEEATPDRIQEDNIQDLSQNESQSAAE